MRRLRWLFPGIALLLACGRQSPEFTLAAPLSPVPVATDTGERTLRVGVGRADITPPPGVALDGNAFEGRQANGWQHRLYARAMVLEDARGERVAFLVADLSHLSSVLQRRTAERILSETGIGADRLVISVTHGHSAPGNFYGESLYNEESGGFPGYDPYMVDFLVDRFSRAITDAFRHRMHAKVAWVSDTVSGFTWNRSFGASRLNTVSHFPVDLQASIAEQRQQSVNHTWTMLRVDQCPGGPDNCRPIGALSIFPMHGTGIPPATQLFDGDLHAIVERGLEQYIERTNPSLARSDPAACDTVNQLGSTIGAGAHACVFASQAVHLLANGTEGDVAPIHLPGSRCGEEVESPNKGEVRLHFRNQLIPEGPRLSLGSEYWTLLPGKSYDDCLALARRSVNEHADALVARVIALFDQAKLQLSDTLTIQRAFTTIDFRDSVRASVLCQPRSGTSALAGADDIRSRLDHWHIAWFIHTGIEEGPDAFNRDKAGCDGAKRVAVGPFQPLMVRNFGFPRFAQFSIVRIGSVLVASTPWELTSEAGRRITEAMDHVSWVRRGSIHSTLIGLANGYFQYATTPEEYEAQEYEGSSDLYGPNTAPVIQSILAGMTHDMPTDTTVQVAPLPVAPGPERSFFPRPTNGPRPDGLERKIESVQCRRTTLPSQDILQPSKRVDRLRFTARWVDAYPGLLVPADGQVIQIEQLTAPDRYLPVAWDDGADGAEIDRSVTVRGVGPTHHGYTWEATWVLSMDHLNQQFRFVVMPRGTPGRTIAFPRLPTPAQSAHDTAVTCH